eukprot:1654090-Rhodomonas_salina.1
MRSSARSRTTLTGSALRWRSCLRFQWSSCLKRDLGIGGWAEAELRALREGEQDHKKVAIAPYRPTYLLCRVQYRPTCLVCRVQYRPTCL